MSAHRQLKGSRQNPLTGRGEEFTEPGLPWADCAALVLGSGPSLGMLAPALWLCIARLQAARHLRVIAANSSVKTARLNGVSPDALFFTDGNWFDANRDLIAAFPGAVYTVSRRAKAEMPDKLQRIQNLHQPDFSIGRPPMKDGRTSGHRAISLSILLGADPIILAGFDMKLSADGRSHCHDDYDRPAPPQLYAQDFLPASEGWGAAARRAGITVVNATPESALREFPRLPLEFLLGLDHRQEAA